MQPIERYGLITLLFLVVSAVAFAMWDAEGSPEARAGVLTPVGEATGAGQGSRLASAPPKRSAQDRIQQAGLGGAPAEAEPRAARPAFQDRAPGQGAPLASPPDGADALSKRGALDAAGDEQADAWTEQFEDEARREARNAQQEAEREPDSRAASPRGQGAGARGERNVAPALDERSAGAGLLATNVTPPAAALETYRVQPGDTLGEIAQRRCGTVHAVPLIQAVNPGLTDRINVGQVLKMPSQAALLAFQLQREKDGGKATATADAPSPARTPEPAPAAAPGATYRVRNGESLWSIAASQLGDGNRYKEILALNPELDPDRIVPGTVLRMPAGAPASVATAPATPADPAFRVR